MSSPEQEDSVAANVAQWTATNAEFTDGAAERSWNDPDLKWGVFGIPEFGVLGEPRMYGARIRYRFGK